MTLASNAKNTNKRMRPFSKCHSEERSNKESLPSCDKTQDSLLLSSLRRTLRKQPRLTAMLPDLELWNWNIMARALKMAKNILIY